MRPSFHLISQFPGLIPFSQQKGPRVQKRVHFSPNQTNQIYINMIEAIFDSESGTTFPFLCFSMNLYMYEIQQVSIRILPDTF